MINLRLVKRSIKFWFQRRIRGWDDSELWSLDYTIAKFALPRLKRFKEYTPGFPADLKDKEEWFKILDEIIWLFEQYENETVWGLSPDEMKRYKNATYLLGERFGSLWS